MDGSEVTIVARRDAIGGGASRTKEKASHVHVVLYAAAEGPELRSCEYRHFLASVVEVVELLPLAVEVVVLVLLGL